MHHIEIHEDIHIYYIETGVLVTHGCIWNATLVDLILVSNY